MTWKILNKKVNVFTKMNVILFVTMEQYYVIHLKENDLDHEAYQRGLQAVARRPLSKGPGLQSYASFRRHGEALRMTAYFSSELFSRP